MNAKPDMRTQLETTFARIKSEREAKEAAELAADSVPTDNVTVLRERATRHAHRAVDGYWGYFNDIQTALDERVITPLLDTVSRIAAERDEARRKLDARNEDVAFLERATLPELRREIEHHKAGKQRWRDRAEKAEACVAELEAASNPQHFGYCDTNVEGHLLAGEHCRYCGKSAEEAAS